MAIELTGVVSRESITLNGVTGAQQITATGVITQRGEQGPPGGVNSVNTRQGDIVLTNYDVGLGNVANVDTTLRSNHTGMQLLSTISDFPSQTGNSGKFLSTNGTVPSWGSPSVDRNLQFISQTAHGLTVGMVVRYNGTAYVGAQGNSIAALYTTVGVVATVTDANNFVINTSGRITGLTGLTAGTPYYVSATTPGALTATDPGLTAGGVSQLVLIATSSTSGYVQISREKHMPVFDVRDFGALIDGTTNDTAAIQAAFNAASAAGGGTVIIPAGTCRVTNLIGYESLIIQGMGSGKTMLRRHASSDTALPLLKMSGTPPTVGSNDIGTHIRYWQIRDIRLHNNDMNGDILWTYYTHRNELHDVWFYAARNGSAVKGVEFWDTRFYFCKFDFVGDDTHPVVNFMNIAAPNVAVSGIATYGFSYDNVNQNHFIGCIWENCSGVHLKLDGVSNGSTSLLNQIWLMQCKFESNQFTDSFIDTTDNTSYVFIDQVYMTANNFRSGYSTPQPLIRIGGTTSSINSMLLNRISTLGTVTHGIEFTSTHYGYHFVNDIFANWNSENIPTRAVINIPAGAASSRVVATNIVSVDGTGLQITDATGNAQLRDRFTINANGSASMTTTANTPSLSLINSAFDATISLRTLGSTKAAYFNLYTVDGVYQSFVGWQNDVVKWRLGRFGRANGLSVYVTNGATEIVHFKDDLRTRIFGGLQAPIVSKTSNYTATATDRTILVDATSGAVTITLPAATSVDGIEYYVKKTDASANAVTIQGTSGATIDGSSTLVLSNQNQAADLKAMTLNWYNMTGTKASIGLGNVDNTSDVTKNSAVATLTNKTISGANNTISNIAQSSVTNLTSDLALKAPLASPALTGTPTAPTATQGNNSTQLATTAYVDAAAAAVEGSDVDSFNSRTGAVLPASGDYTAAQITNTPAGSVAATTVQAAIDELDAEKAIDTMVVHLAGTETITGTKNFNTSVGLGTTTPTHSLTYASTATGVASYNTSDQTTNYERVRNYWATNVYNILSEAGGTGTVRAVLIGNSTISNISINFVGSSKQVFTTASGSANIVGAQFIHTATNSSALATGLAITPVYNQTSTGAGTDLLINRTQTAVGSGAQLFIDAQVAGVSKFKVDNLGHLTTGASTTAGSSLNMPSGTAPTTPVNGDIWYDGSHFQGRANGVTYQLDNVGGANPVEVTGTSQAMVANQRYIANNAGLVTLTLPSTASQGDQFLIRGKGTGGWKLAQNASQVIHGATDTTTGTGGSLASQTRYDCVTVECITANTDFLIINQRGTLTTT